MLKKDYPSVAMSALSVRPRCAGDGTVPSQRFWARRPGRAVRALQQASAAIGAALLLLTGPAMAEQAGAYLQQAPGLHGAIASRSTERLPWDLRLLQVVAKESGLDLALGSVTLSPLPSVPPNSSVIPLMVCAATSRSPSPMPRPAAPAKTAG